MLATIVIIYQQLFHFRLNEIRLSRFMACTHNTYRHSAVHSTVIFFICKNKIVNLLDYSLCYGFIAFYQLTNKIESKLSMIARQGRAFGIHLILATQRPDSNILHGQIKNNITYRICGRADNVLSQIILDNTSAADQIPEDSQGRFILNDGTVFQAYWFDDAGGI